MNAAGWAFVMKENHFSSRVVYEVNVWGKQRADDRIKSACRSMLHQLTLKCDFIRGEREVIGVIGEQQWRQLCVLHLMSLTEFQSFTSRDLFKSHQSQVYLPHRLLTPHPSK